MPTTYSNSGHAITVLAAVILTSCASDVSPVTGTAEKQPLVVSAAASTKDLMDELAKAFATMSGIEVKVNAGPSNALATQILAGAPADLFLSANQQWAEEIDQAGRAAESVRLLTNRLVIVVPEGNPGEVHEPRDLLSEKVQKIALAGENVPAGIYAEQALTKLDLLPQLIAVQKIARGQDVRNSLSFVERGEAEAGIVYSTDVRVAPKVKTVYEFDPSLHDEIVYVLVLLKHEGEQATARQLFDFLQSPNVEATYGRYGFTRLR